MQISQVVLLFVGVVFAHSVTANLECVHPPVPIAVDWTDMENSCITKMRDQVNVELTAAMTYMAMGAYFARDSVNRPGFSKMFFDSASEEREHAIKIITYLLMRGELTEQISDLIKNPRPEKQVWTDGVNALQDALTLEVSVTKNVRDIIKVCEDEGSAKNDYHLVDYLTSDFLEEQYNGQRDLAGKIQTLGKMTKSQGDLGEFLFDKKLLNGSPL